MDSRQWFPRVSAVFVGAVLAAGFCVLLYKIRGLFLPFGIGFLVAYLFDPLLDRLEARGWTRLRAVWTVMAALALTAVVVGALIVPPIIAQAQDAAYSWGRYANRAYALYEDNREQVIAWIELRFPRLGIDVGETLDRAVGDARDWALRSVPQALRWIVSRLLKSASLLFQGLIIALISFHFMMVIDPFRAGLRRLLPEAQAEEVGVVGGQIGAMVGAFLRGQIIVSVLVATSLMILLTILGAVFGTQYGLILGLVGGVIYIVPWVGAVVTTVAAAFIGYFTADHHLLLSALCAVGVVVAVNQVSDNIVMPRIVGRRVGLHPLAVLFAIMAGYSVWGIAGMIVAVPIAASIKIAAQRWVPTMPRLEEKEHAVPDLDLVSALKHAMDGARSLVAGWRHVGSGPAVAAAQPPSAPQPPDGAGPDREDKKHDDDPAA